MSTTEEVRRYWDTHIHDLGVSDHPPGSRAFFDDLDQYHFEKLHHLLRLVDFPRFAGQRVLDVGCGAGVEVVRFARVGAAVSGVDLAPSAIALARANCKQQGLTADLQVADGEALPFPEASFDVVYAHGVVQYSAHPERLVHECWRVLRPGGQAIVQVYNRISWLRALSVVMKVPLEHEDAPALRMFTAGTFRRLLSDFAEVRIVPERFPVHSRLHHGWKGALYNGVFVGTFQALPRGVVQRFGWHLLAFCRK